MRALVVAFALLLTGCVDIPTETVVVVCVVDDTLHVPLENDPGGLRCVNPLPRDTTEAG